MFTKDIMKGLFFLYGEMFRKGKGVVGTSVRRSPTTSKNKLVNLTCRC